MVMSTASFPCRVLSENFLSQEEIAGLKCGKSILLNEYVNCDA